MKSVAATVIAGMLAFTGSSSYISKPATTNYVVNGDFSDNSCDVDFCIWDKSYFQSSDVVGWKPQPEIEIGKGSIYNSNFGAHQYVAELDPNENTCITQHLKHIPAGRYQFSFDWAARMGRSFGDNTFGVYIGGHEIGTITPTDYEIHTNVAYVELPYSCDGIDLTFSGLGDSTSFGAVVTNIQLTRKSDCIHPPKFPPKPEKPEIHIEIVHPDKPHISFPVPEKPDIEKPGKPVIKPPPIYYPGKPGVPDVPNPDIPDIDIPDRPDFDNGCKGELVKNGGFEQNACQSDFCIYDIWNFDPSYVPGWTPVDQIEVGHAGQYNSNAGNSQVAELDAHKNTCITQEITTCSAGKFVLKFNYAARQGKSLDTSIFQVLVNGEVVRSIIPTNYHYNHEQIVLDLEAAQNSLTFCAYSNSDSFGAIIDNVSVKCATACEVCTFAPKY